MASIAAIEHIVEDESGVAWIKDSNTKVIEVILDREAYGWSAEEIHFQHPRLSLAQIHAALAYYYDHQAQLDAEITRRLSEVEELRRSTPFPPLAQRLLERNPNGN
jgi:uncharacterized protein (DUF433 family)